MMYTIFLRREAFEDVREVGNGWALNLQTGNSEAPMECDIMACGFSCKDTDNSMRIIRTALLEHGAGIARVRRMIYVAYM